MSDLTDLTWAAKIVAAVSNQAGGTGSTQTLAVIGTITGSIGALTGILSLAWQIRVHQLSGRRVSVKAVNIIPVYGPIPPPKSQDDDQVGITVTNRGGAPVSVTNYGVAMGGKRSKKNLFVTKPPVWANRLPQVVEPGGPPVQVYVPVAELRKAHAEHGIPYRRMRPWVQLGDDRRVYSRNAVPLK